MKKHVKLVVGAVSLLAIDYQAPVLDVGFGVKASIASVAGMCHAVQGMGFGAAIPSGGVCDWTPIVHYASIAVALGLVAFAVKEFMALNRAESQKA